MISGYNTEEFKKFYFKYIRSLSSDQADIFEAMSEYDRLNICMPTGTGKSRIIYADMMTYLNEDSYDIFVLGSHRLMLNTQHFDEIFENLNIVVGSVGYIFVGSTKVDYEKYTTDSDFNKRCKEAELNSKDLIYCTTSPIEIKERIKFYKEKNMDVVIVTTYNSM